MQYRNAVNDMATLLHSFEEFERGRASPGIRWWIMYVEEE